MNTRKFFPTLVFIFSVWSFFAQNRKTIHIHTLGADYSYIYIDGNSQSVSKGKHFVLSAVPAGKHKLLVETRAAKTWRNEIEIGTHPEKDEYYSLRQNDNQYTLHYEPNPTKISGLEEVLYLSYYLPRPRPAESYDSTKKTVHSCQLTDSAVNSILFRMNDLPTEKAKSTFLTNSLRYKCLLTHQISALCNKIKSDNLRVEEYKKYYPNCNDKHNYYKLIQGLYTEHAATEFKTWILAQPH